MWVCLLTRGFTGYRTPNFRPGLELCEQYEVTPQNLVYKWEAYADKHGEESPKVEHFEILRAEIARKSSVKQEKGSQSSVHRLGARQGM